VVRTGESPVITEMVRGVPRNGRSIWLQHRGSWMCCLGGVLGLTADPEDPYTLLADIRVIFVPTTTLTFAVHRPFPKAG